MNKLNNELKLVFLFLSISIYLGFMIAHFTTAQPAGADVTPISTDYGPNATPGPRTDPGGTITTLSLDVTQQDSAWKAYVGNITGVLVLRNTDGYSIFEWTMNSSTMTGNVFVTRNDSINWSSSLIRCANSTIINSEQNFFGMLNGDSDSINKTFNYTTHRAMTIGGVGTIQNGTCPSTATYVNGTKQVMNQNTSTFQEILLYDTQNLIFATFVTQDAWAYNNNESAGGANVTYDFQLIVAENDTHPTGSTYYFYADISG